MNALAMAKTRGRPRLPDDEAKNATWLEAELALAGLSQKELADALGMSSQNVSLWVNSGRMPTKRITEVRAIIEEAKQTGGRPNPKRFVIDVDWLKVVSVIKIIQATHADTWEELSDEERAELLEFAYNSIASENPGINAFVLAQK